MNNLDALLVKVPGWMFVQLAAQLGADHVFFANQNNVHIVAPNSLQRALDLWYRRAIRSHGINRYDGGH
jgi:hypothetical protein